MDTRQTCIAINRQFETLSKLTGLQLKTINVGSAPGDCEGDTSQEAAASTLNNLLVVLIHLAERTSHVHRQGTG